MLHSRSTERPSPNAPFYVYLGQEVNMMNDLAPELGRRKRSAWGACKSIEDVVKKTQNTRLVPTSSTPRFSLL
ncbi:hypothetical protein Y032_0322g2436 [Ancylostoma ceylanicum]|uniref:Uncharacterized protein n=1 Tax=Ancylostoma ceylanicum TaxID=53326 RepID=A0A016S1D1_9BILA|nr:hypothetical protein Y032_0322g2436 [Ancylostoma ceylanicum]